MRKLLVVAGLVGSLGSSGCVVRAGATVRGPNPIAVIATGLAVAAVVNAVTQPPPMTVDVGYYGQPRAGYVWVNGHHTWNGSMWVWTPGYYQVDRPGNYWVQGSWQPRGNQYVWVDGYWAPPRAGYVYVDGYYDYRGNGYVWTPGRWENERPGYVYVQGTWNTSGGRRTWQQGSWQPRSTPTVRDHRSR